MTILDNTQRLPRFRNIQRRDLFPEGADYVGPFGGLLETLGLSEEQFLRLTFTEFCSILRGYFANNNLQLALVKRNGTWEYLTLNEELYLFMQYQVRRTGANSMDTYAFDKQNEVMIEA